jgi:cytochrome c-type biogenesis protein CcmE
VSGRPRAHLLDECIENLRIALDVDLHGIVPDVADEARNVVLQGYTPNLLAKTDALHQTADHHTASFTRRQLKAGIPVIASPRMRVCISLVPS